MSAVQASTRPQRPGRVRTARAPAVAVVMERANGFMCCPAAWSNAVYPATPHETRQIRCRPPVLPVRTPIRSYNFDSS